MVDCSLSPVDLFQRDYRGGVAHKSTLQLEIDSLQEKKLRQSVQLLTLNEFRV